MGKLVAEDRPSIKPGEIGQMIQSVRTICGINAMTFNMLQLHLICAFLMLTGYHSKPKPELLWIIGVGCLQQALCAANLPIGRAAEAEKVCTKLTIVLFD